MRKQILLGWPKSSFGMLQNIQKNFLAILTPKKIAATRQDLKKCHSNHRLFRKKNEARVLRILQGREEIRDGEKQLLSYQSHWIAATSMSRTQKNPGSVSVLVVSGSLVLGAMLLRNECIYG